jgi:diguanylate cyclase (GGDEF)-like protein
MRPAVSISGRTEAGEHNPAWGKPQADERHGQVLQAEKARRWCRYAPLFAGIVVLSIAAVGGGASAYFAAREDNANGVHARLADALDEVRTDFAISAAGRAETVAAAVSSFGITAPDIERILAPVELSYPHRRAYLINSDGSLAGAFPPEETEIPPSLRRLITHFQAEHTKPVLASADAMGLRGITPPAETDIVVYKNRPAIAAVAAVVPWKSLHETSTRFPSIVVTIASLDEGLVATLGNKAQISKLRVETEPFPAGSSLFSQTDNRGRIVAWFGWEAKPSVWKQANQFWSLLGFSGFAFLGFGVVAARRAGNPAVPSDSYLQAGQRGKEDPLTHVPNRRATIATLEEALARRPEDQIVAFACLNLDGFKEINGTLGHETGDQLLIAAADRLCAAVPNAASVGRINGDEFAAIITVKDESAAMDAVQACARTLAAPIVIRDHTIHISASIGLAHAPQDGASCNDLVRRADLASRAAKKRGRGRVIAFHHGLEAEINERRFIERELRQALLDEQLDLAYQPIVAGDGLTTIGAEALVRWQHPARGVIPPGLFVSVAEQTGMMIQLGRFVMRRALEAARSWPNLYIAINLSPVQVRDRALVRAVSDALEESQVDPHRVVLEITEGVLIDNPEEAKQRLKDLRALGVKIALDDFGSGYSSLNYLRRLPIDKLKIDKEFVSPLGRSANGTVIIEAIVTLGRALGLSVLAEGVESEEQRVLLRLAGCDELQGFLFARPMPRDSMTAFLAASA